MDDLFYAVKNGNIDKVKELIDAGADLNAKDKWKCTPLHVASMYEVIDIVKLLIDAGADVDARDCNWDTPLHSVIERSFTDIAKLLIDAGADIYAHNGEDQLPIALAFNDYNVELIRFIVDQMEKDIEKWKKMEKDIKNRKGKKNG